MVFIHSSIIDQIHRKTGSMRAYAAVALENYNQDKYVLTTLRCQSTINQKYLR